MTVDRIHRIDSTRLRGEIITLGRLFVRKILHFDVINDGFDNVSEHITRRT